ncbi:MAG: NAD-dependent epimerase/dehydratase family protein [Roseiflexaceae bacterium]|nr:NAD-dependent epimerase/dehydratase family protein [Roseiflexaceae bacterium]
MTGTNELHVVFGTGPVGRAVIDALARRGKRVRAVNRRGVAVEALGVETVAGDASDAATTTRLSEGAMVVYNCTNPPYTQWPELFPALNRGVLAGAAAAGAKLVVMDNLYMYGPTGGRPLTEDLPYAAKTRKGRVRAQMARELLDAHARGDVRVAIGRASDFFGPGVRDSSFGERVFEPALAGKPVQLIGKPDLPHTASYVPDIGEALVTLGEHDTALGRAWHLPAAETLSTRAFVERVFAAAGQKPQVQVAPVLLLRAIGLFNPMLREVAEMGYEFEEPFILDHSAFAQSFGAHVTPLDTAIAATMNWYRSQPPHAAEHAK